MVNEKLILDFLRESYKRKLQYKQRYEHCHDTASKKIYRDAYLKALDLYSARYQMLLLFGYDVVYDENNNIIGIKKI